MRGNSASASSQTEHPAPWLRESRAPAPRTTYDKKPGRRGGWEIVRDGEHVLGTVADSAMADRVLAKMRARLTG